MPDASKNRPLDWSKRARADLDRIYDYYLEAAPYDIAEQSIATIVAEARRIARLNLVFRPGRHGTREAILSRFPFTIVYRIEPRKIRIVRVLHQAREYFNR
ncbi:MAG: type II toxin-antitoxin system RelE/ParE family toxin [Rhodocyclaceae bacterium]|nr:type II toxin-antitoxin system RelE/ParE family toxin [Rhodocyclaceae bacterium]MDP1957258.1 type II toxin-antitoxin system RelE/ParE family toxin [Rhodocyclaceae bacterium]